MTNGKKCGIILNVERETQSSLKTPPADLAHLVERDLAKVEVAGSRPVIRSKNFSGAEIQKFQRS